MGVRPGGALIPMVVCLANRALRPAPQSREYSGRARPSSDRGPPARVAVTRYRCLRLRVRAPIRASNPRPTSPDATSAACSSGPPVVGSCGVGPKFGELGELGDPGSRGVPGNRGVPGEPAEDGELGEPVEDGEPGEPVEDGELGEPVEDGELGEPAEDGVPGELGEPAEDGEPG